MLHTLHIENIAVIRSLDVTFGPGLTVLTGETGAGKSVLVDSLLFVTGGKATRDLIRTGESAATVSAVFSDTGESVRHLAERLGIPTETDGEFLLSRTVREDGKSVARVNGSPVTVAMLRELGGALMTLHGQHDSIRITREEEQRAAVDGFADNGEVLHAYAEAYQALSELISEKKRLETDEAESLRLTEILEFQIRDIDAKKLRVGEEELLLAERDKLRGMGKILRQVEGACRLLTDREEVNAASLVERAGAAIRQLAPILPETSELSEALAEVSSEITDLSERIRELIPETDGDPNVRLDKIERRLEAIARLRKKYGATVAEVLAFRENAAGRLEELNHASERIAEIGQAEKRLSARAAECADALRATREKAATEISARVREGLAFLDMPKVRFEIRVTPAPLCATGGDHVEFLLSANVGEAPAPMSEIASGGELSRIMLALSDVLHGAGGASTVVYDEIDTGISGSTSRRVGIKLKRGAVGGQILAVTHSAQIASLADAHWFLSKSEKDGRTETTIRELTGEDQIAEIARILGGMTVTDAQRAAAVDMIEEGKTF